MYLSHFESGDEIDLLKKLQQGDSSAFSNLYNQYSKAIYRKILWMLNDEEVAKELLQELFLKLWENRDKIDLAKSFKSYLYTIAVNLVYDYFRKASKRKEYEEHILSMAVDYYSHIEEAMVSNENIQLISNAIDQLPPQRKQVFMLCRVEGKSYEEVGELLNISRSTIHDHIVKANRVIKEYLSNHPDALLYLIIWAILAS